MYKPDTPIFTPELNFKSFEVYKGIGDYLYKLKDVVRAVQYYNAAEHCARTKKDFYLLRVGRARFNLEMGLINTAKRDLHHLLVTHPNDLEVIQLLSSLQLAEKKFDRSLIEAMNGYHYRKQPPNFLDSIILGKDLYYSNIGPPAGQIMSMQNLGSSIVKMIRAKSAAHGVVAKTSGPNLSPAKQAQLERKLRKKSKSSDFNAIGDQAYTKQFFEEVMKYPSSKGDAMSTVLKCYGNLYLNMMNSLKEFSWAQSPLYLSKKDSVMSSSQKLKNSIDKYERIMVAEKHLMKKFLIIMASYLGDDWTTFLQKVEEFRMYIHNKTNYKLPQKMVYLNKIYTIVAKAMLRLKTSQWKLPKDLLIKRIWFMMGGKEGGLPSIILYRPHFHPPMRNLQFLLRDFGDALKLTEISSERDYLLFEIACIHSMNGHSKKVRETAKELVTKTENPYWYLNGLLIMTKGEIMSGNYKAAKSAMIAYLVACLEIDDLQALFLGLQIYYVVFVIYEPLVCESTNKELSTAEVLLQDISKARAKSEQPEQEFGEDIDLTVDIGEHNSALMGDLGERGAEGSEVAEGKSGDETSEDKSKGGTDEDADDATTEVSAEGSDDVPLLTEKRDRDVKADIDSEAEALARIRKIDYSFDMDNEQISDAMRSPKKYLYELRSHLEIRVLIEFLIEVAERIKAERPIKLFGAPEDSEMDESFYEGSRIEEAAAPEVVSESVKCGDGPAKEPSVPWWEKTCEQFNQQLEKRWFQKKKCTLDKLLLH